MSFHTEVEAALKKAGWLIRATPDGLPVYVSPTPHPMALPATITANIQTAIVTQLGAAKLAPATITAHAFTVEVVTKNAGPVMDLPHEQVTQLLHDVIEVALKPLGELPWVVSVHTTLHT